MLRRSRFLTLLVPAFLAAPSAADAQYTFGGGYPFGGGGGYFGNVAGFGFGGYGLGGYGLGGYGLGGYGGYGLGAYGAPGMISPYGVVPGISNGYYSPAWSYGSPYYASGITRSSPTISPGFGASEMPRTRSNFYPAIPAPSKQVIAAALEQNETTKDKARIEIHVPTPEATVSIDGVPTRQTGLDRTFVTPALNPGSRYTLQFEVAYQDETGRPRAKRREVTVRAGETVRLDFGDGD